MAKRKRLSPADPSKTPVLETKTAVPAYKDARHGPRPPIAGVAGDAAASAALADLSDQIAEARAQGRMILELSLSVIDERYLVRDRLTVDATEMQSLVESIRARGQQTPIEVVALGEGRYGLISGWRRLEALARLSAEGDERPALALLRVPDDDAEAYLAMVEENEIRVGLSYYERAAVAAAAVDQGVYENEKRALLHIYHAASRAKRSKIRSFLTVVRALDGALAFPTALSERTGLALAQAIETHEGFISRLRRALLRDPSKTAEEEAKRIAQAIRVTTKQTLSRPKTPKTSTSPPAPLPKGVAVQTRSDGAVVLSGPGLNEALRRRLFEWLTRQ